MFDQDANIPTAPTHGAPSPDAIAQWKSAVQEFFSREWDSLRDLMRKLEEHDWDGANLTAPENAEPAQPFHSRVVDEIAAKARVEPELPAAPDTSRLADLAKRLESQLKRKADNV